MRNFFKIVFFAIFILFAYSNLSAQVFGVNYNATWHTNYIFGNYDTIYIYNVSDADIYTKKITLKAISHDSTKGWTFFWDKYNSQDKIYKQFAVTPLDSISIIDTLTAGAYQVRMKKVSRIDTFRTWVIINKLRLHLKKNPKGEVRALTYFCKYLPLGIIDRNNGQEDPDLRYVHDDNLFYENPERNSTVSIPNPITIDWKADPDFPMDKTSTNDGLQIYIHNAPVPDGTDTTVFTINFRDAFGNTATDFVKYKTQNTRADFDIYGTDSLPAYTLKDTAGDAPFYAYFKNKSKRGIKFEWFVADTIAYNRKDSIHFFTTDIKDSGRYTYYFPKTYHIKLVSTSPEGCTDTLITKTIAVKTSQLGKSDSLHFPNAFTPDGDGKNDFFTYKADTWHSIQNLHLSVFNQWGKLVYDYNDPVSRGWKGWDGKIGALNLEARPGIYFYTYQAIGWGPIKQGNDSTHNTLPIKRVGSGFVYLFRK